MGKPTTSQDTALAGELVARFQVTHEGRPGWAWPFNPPVPLVGKRYRPGRGLLIYASAENLSWLHDEPTPPRFKTADAWNRYRIRYEEAGRRSADFFPDVGIAPVNNGGLLVAGLFTATRLGLPVRARPRAFLETIAVSNWCKFVIRSDKNRDYIANVKKLTQSLPYVIGELAVLRPTAVLIPQAVWRHQILQAAMRGASPWTRFLPVPQFNARIVNITLAKHYRAAQALRRRLAGTPLAAWMTHLRGLNERNAWRYLAMLNAAF
ncbi:MAG: hypothetical protein J7M21_00710 [Planctomycetes bacterium]|nr:hypothetical protein [Planctomycetota bacterium]